MVEKEEILNNIAIKKQELLNLEEELEIRRKSDIGA